MQKKIRNDNGFTMIEVLIALVVFSVGLLAMASMQAMAIKSNAMAYNTTVANSLAQSMIDRFHSDPSNTASFNASATIDYNGWRSEVSGLLPEGTGVVAVAPVTTSSNRVSVTVSWKQNDSNTDVNHKNHQVVLTTIM